MSLLISSNVEVSLRITDASRSVYRIRDVESAINTAATSFKISCRST